MHSEVDFGTDIAHTVVGLAEVRALVHGLDIPDDETLALVAHHRSSHRNIAIILPPENVRLRISTDHALKVDGLAGEDGLVLRLFADKGFHWKGGEDQ